MRNNPVADTRVPRFLIPTLPTQGGFRQVLLHTLLFSFIIGALWKSPNKLKGLETLARILVIDDEVGIRQVIKLAASQYDVTILEAETGQTGLDIAISEQPDAIILDFRLPDIAGDEIAERYRVRGGLAPIILLSASAEIDRLARHPAITVALSKPFRLAELWQTLESLINLPSPRPKSSP